MEIKNILYINLEKRKDRREHVEKQLSSIGLSGERFNAVQLKNGRVGCSMSHLKCVELAKSRNWDHVMIIEDDITFTKPRLFMKQLKKFLSRNIKWDVLLLAGNNIPPYKKYGDFCIKVSYCQTTTGYIVKKDYYNTLIENYREGIKQLMREPEKHREFAIDKNWIKLQKKDNWFFIIPASVVQRPDYSDIEGKVINYNWHMLDIDKTEFMKRRNEALKQQQEMQNRIHSNTFRNLKFSS